MPVRWTPENDQILLLKIIETHELSVDTKKVSEAWPGNDPDNSPTPRAISERLHKIRNTAKQNGGSLPAGPKSPVTPRKRGPRGGSTPGSKRVRKIKDIKEDPDSSPTSGHVKQETKEAVDAVLRSNGNGQVKGLFSDPVLAKRVRTTPVIPLGMVRYVNDDTDDEAKYETGSEFNPDGENYGEDDDDVKSEFCA